MVERRLGRGLDFFLSGGRGTTPGTGGAQTPPAAAAVPAGPGAQVAAAAAAGTPADLTLQVEVGLLAPSPHQPRRDFGEGELAELAASIRASGMLQPILTRKVGERYEIVAGERRWRAAKLAGLERVPVLVKAITDDESAVFGLVENIQREDLNAMEKATAFRKLVDRFQASQEEVARRVGLDRSTVANFLRLLDLPDAVQAHVSRGTLSMGHARALLGLADADARVKLADESIRQGWSVRALEQRVKELSLGPSPAPTPAVPGTSKAGPSGRARPVWLAEIEENLAESLGTPVAVHYGKKRSSIVIECAGREEFERIYSKLKNL